MDSAEVAAVFVMVGGTACGALMGGYCIFVGFRDLNRGAAVLKVSKDKPLSGGAAKAFNICLIILGAILILFAGGAIANHLGIIG